MTNLEAQNELKAIFIAGQIMGLAMKLKIPLLKEAQSKSKDSEKLMELIDQLDANVLERFLKSKRSRDPTDPFRYRAMCEQLIQFKRSHTGNSKSPSRTSSRRKNDS